MKKKNLLLAVMLLCMSNVNAQVDNTFCFLDADNNEVKDGSTVTFYAEEVAKIPGMPELGTELKAGFNLKVKNTTDATATVAAHLVTKEMSCGSVQFCFPGQCVNNVPVDFTTDCGDIDAGKTKALNSEWFPEKGKYGNATFTLQLLVADKTGDNNFTVKANGPTVNINCIYSDPAGIADMESDQNVTVIGRYDCNGNKLSIPVKGVNIIRLSNGTIRKIVVK